MKKILFNCLFLFSFLTSQNVTSAVKATSNPVMDGDVLNDLAWNDVPAVTTFIQKTPDEGDNVSENTVVKVMYSDKIFFVSVVCYDSKPNEIVISDTRRDSPLNNSDSFSFIIDTFKDFQTGYLFGTNPAGIEYDAQITGGGEGGSMMRRFSMGTGGGFNVNWDAVWEVKSQRGDYGWSAEFAIPFKTLRYKEGKDQSWGINFERVIARNKEEAHWAPISRQFTMNRLVSAGTLTQMNVPSSRNIKIMPYVLGQNNEKKEETSSKSNDGTFGLDGKISVGSSMSLDLTYNTDFAQVEADEPGILFRECRTFFCRYRWWFFRSRHRNVF